MFVLRPTPGDWVNAQIAGGRDSGYSASWWQKGALVVDRDGPAVVDAEGRRVPVPVPPGGGILYRVSTPSNSSAYGSSPGFKFHFLCDRDDRRIAMLPGNDRDGFDAAEVQRFADAARFEYRTVHTPELDKRFPKTPDYLDLHWCVRDDENLHKKESRILRALRVGRNYTWSPYKDGKTYPPMDPAYLHVAAGSEDDTAAGTATEGNDGHG